MGFYPADGLCLRDEIGVLRLEKTGLAFPRIGSPAQVLDHWDDRGLVQWRDPVADRCHPAPHLTTMIASASIVHPVANRGAEGEMSGNQ
jgi:hypothetical protein